MHKTNIKLKQKRLRATNIPICSKVKRAVTIIKGVIEKNNLIAAFFLTNFGGTNIFFANYNL